MKERFIEIDHLRGLAMLAMILIHTNAYFLSDSPLVKSLWDWSQFAVPVFIMCSAYLFFVKTPAFNLGYLKKRFIRLLKPYYVFMIIFFLAILLREPGKLTPSYIGNSIFVTGGIDINWLVLLFLQFTFLIPLLTFLWKKLPILFWIYTVTSVVCSIVLVFWHVPFDYKFVMWLPYSLFLIYTLLLVKFKNNTLFSVLSLTLSAGVFILLRVIELHMHHSLTFYDNKYPPNLYFLSFGIFSIDFLYLIAVKKVFDVPAIKQLFDFLSRNSYSLYFIHYVYLYLISWTFTWLHFNWITFFIAVFGSALITQWVFNQLKKSIAFFSYF